MQKICKTCGIEKPVSEFSAHRTNKDGYNGKCKLCVAEYGRLHRERNIEKELERSKQYYDQHKLERKEYFDSRKSIITEYGKKYRADNSILISTKRKAAYRANKEKINAQVYCYYKKRINNDPLFKLKKQVQGLIRDSLRGMGFKKSQRTVDILGCSIEEFKLYVESKFEPWMNWGNKGLYNGSPNYGWDIDHIKKSSSATSEGELIQLNHYTNLQPMCSYLNRVIKR